MPFSTPPPVSGGDILNSGINADRRKIYSYIGKGNEIIVETAEELKLATSLDIFSEMIILGKELTVRTRKLEEMIRVIEDMEINNEPTKEVINKLDELLAGMIKFDLEEELEKIKYSVEEVEIEEDDIFDF